MRLLPTAPGRKLRGLGSSGDLRQFRKVKKGVWAVGYGKGGGARVLAAALARLSSDAVDVSPAYSQYFASQSISYD